MSLNSFFKKAAQAVEDFCSPISDPWNMSLKAPRRESVSEDHAHDCLTLSTNADDTIRVTRSHIKIAMSVPPYGRRPIVMEVPISSKVELEAATREEARAYVISQTANAGAGFSHQAERWDSKRGQYALQYGL